MKFGRNFADNHKEVHENLGGTSLIIIRISMKTGGNFADNHKKAHEIWEDLR